MAKPGKKVSWVSPLGVIIAGILLSAGCGGGTEGPAAPSALQATAYSATRIDLAWTDNSIGEDGFRIERKTGPEGTYSLIGTAGGNSIGYSDFGLACETTYYYQIHSFNKTGDSGNSNEVNATTLACPLALPGAPSNLTAAVVSNSEIDIYWQDNSNQEDGIKIERKTGAGGTYSQVGTAGADSTRYRDTALTCENDYYYRVRSYNAAGSSGYSGEANAATGACPAAPSNLQAAAISSSRIDLSWADNSSDESGFQVERKRGAGGSYFPVYASAADVTAWSDSGLGGGETYYYRVAASYPGGSSAYSNETSAVTPEGATATAGMVWIPADCFQMGAAADEGYDNEKPAHLVCVSAFQMDIYEVTNADYQKCVDNGFADGFCKRPGDTGSVSGQRSPYYGNTAYANYPVIFVTWSQAEKYCRLAGKRLPTEAEWEFAGRGGLEGKKCPWGDDVPVCTPGAVNGAQNGSCFAPNEMYHDTAPRGYFAPNGFGLYDMAGNVWEWVNDWYDAGYYSSSPVNNPPGPGQGYPRYKVLRGGSFYLGFDDLRVSRRYYDYNDSTMEIPDPTYGFRCAK